ncbi:MAG TPA: ribosome silencing factor, partial [Trueperaceae bacterium]|nr:ribosome silencing factor [Trueperaceae bacterium]
MSRLLEESLKDEMISSSEDVLPATSTAVPIEVQVVVDALDDKRAVDIAVLDLRSASETLDWFIVASGESSLQLKALEDSVREGMKKAGHYPKGVEGPSARWVLLDYGAVVVHVMSPEAREFYDLEGLWADAERVAV